MTVSQDYARDVSLTEINEGDRVTVWGTVNDGKPVLSPSCSISAGAPLPRGVETGIRAGLVSIFPAISATALVAGTRRAVREQRLDSVVQAEIGIGVYAAMASAAIIAMVKKIPSRKQPRK